MSDDLVQLLIYVVIGLVGVIASAYRSKKKLPQAGSGPARTVVPRNLPADPGKDFGPELGPLMELFDIPRPNPVPNTYETVESGPAIEEAGMTVDSKEASAELAGMSLESEGRSVEERDVEAADDYQEGQSDLQKLIAKYEEINKRLNQEDSLEEISAGEIVSPEQADSNATSAGHEVLFDARKAIIYSEILKRKEF